MESAMQGDERCVLDTMRLVDLLLVLLFEGRKALPKSTAGSTGRIPGLRRLDSSGERSHRQLIDCIRSKDTDALIDAIDTGGGWVDSMGSKVMHCKGNRAPFGTQIYPVCWSVRRLGYMMMWQRKFVQSGVMVPFFLIHFSRLFCVMVNVSCL